MKYERPHIFFWLFNHDKLCVVRWILLSCFSLFFFFRRFAGLNEVAWNSRIVKMIPNVKIQTCKKNIYIENKKWKKHENKLKTDQKKKECLNRNINFLSIFMSWACSCLLVGWLPLALTLGVAWILPSPAISCSCSCPESVGFFTMIS